MASDAPVLGLKPSSSSSGLRKVFSKNKARNNSAAVSGEDSLQPRNSLDSTERSPNRKSTDSGHDGSISSGKAAIGKLIPGRSRKSRRRRASELKESDAEIQRGRLADTPSPSTTPQPQQSLNESTSSLLNDTESNLLTDDSEPENSNITRPNFDTRESHAGYLTTSSPLITAKKVEIPASPEPIAAKSSQIDGAIHDPNGASTPPSEDLTESTTDSQPQSSSLSNFSLFKTNTLDPPSDQSLPRRESVADSLRGISPGRKLKDAFAPNLNKSPSISPDRGSTKSSGSGKLGGFLGKKSSITERRQTQGDSKPAPPEIQTFTPDKTNSSRASLPQIDTARPPRTPPNAPVTGPLTTVTPPTPTDPQSGSPSSSPRGKTPNNGAAVSPSGGMIGHRRAKSEHLPSKLSNTISVPSTPGTEEARTPVSGKSTNAQTAGNFFSTWVSAAQNAANSINISINPTNRSRSSTQNADQEKTRILEPTPEEEEIDHTVTRPAEKKKVLAVDTLGMGDLNFGHLGLDTNGDEKRLDALKDSNELKQNQTIKRDEASARLEDARAARAVSAAYERPVRDSSTTITADDAQSVLRHRDTLSSNLSTDDRTPPTSIFEGEPGSGIKRSNSSRSRLTHRRGRGSSTGTGQSTIGALIGGSASTLANPAIGPKLTGFAIAPKARNRSFHQLFRSVPEDDYLIEDYSCALQRDILLAGRIYISEGHICFSSNILGWVTTLVISFDEVVSIEKESTAMVFPNAIGVQTLHARHTFRSLLSREATYDLMIGIWKASHPGTFKSSVNGVQIESGTGDKTDRTGDVEPSSESDEEEIYDEDEDEEEDAESFPDTNDGSFVGSELSAPAKAVSRKSSAINQAGAAPPVPNLPVPGDPAQGEKAAAAVSEATGNDFPGPATHAPTDCADSATHFEKVVKDEMIPAPLGKIYTMIFGPNSPVFVSRFITEDQKCLELNFDDKTGLSNDKKSRQYTYIKPLGGSIGPKQTKCITTENLDAFDLEKAISVTCTTQTPDVPSGNAFSVKTRYCLSWAPGNATRFQMNCGIEWTAKSWLKGPIEKGAIEGQLAYGNDIIKALKAGVSSRSRALTGASRVGKGKKKRKGDAKSLSSPQASGSASKSQDWGLFEPLHGILGPVADIVGPLFSANVIIIILLTFIVVSWIRGPARLQSGNGLSNSSARLAAYEELWQKEESELWTWLEERVGMEGVSLPKAGGSKHSDTNTKAKAKQRNKILNDKDVAARLREEKMSEREVEEAIRVTQERLNALKGVVNKNKDKTNPIKPQRTKPVQPFEKAEL